MLTALYLISGLLSLYFGAEWLVKGSASLAQKLGLSPLMVGLTVVAYGTSAPELVVSSMAAWQGQGSLALGNAVGSNVFNVGLVLGLSAIITPLQVQSQLVKLDTPILLGSSLLFLLFFQDHTISQPEALTLLAGVLAYTTLHVLLARTKITPSTQNEFKDNLPSPADKWTRDAGLILVGLAALTLGSRLFILGAAQLARAWGLSEAIIGLTIVAAGTGLPELAASVIAACRKQTDIAIGNIVGSNIYNLLAIIGTSGTIAGPLLAPDLGQTEVLIMVFISAILLPLAWTGYSLRRWEGCVLLSTYAAYTYYLWPK
ncbi:MAG: hypothetical protein RI897_3194 [Verrucomicrobiota bacterium]|jgi:cation:H+ antiporter